MAVGICNSNQHDNLNEDMIVAVVNCNLTNKLQINPKKFSSLQLLYLRLHFCTSHHLKKKRQCKVNSIPLTHVWLNKG